MKTLIPVIITLLWAVAIYCLGHLHCRMQMHKHVLRPWLAWHGALIDRMKAATGDEWEEPYAALKADEKAYSAFTRVFYSTTFPWEKPAPYTREE